MRCYTSFSYYRLELNLGYIPIVDPLVNHRQDSLYGLLRSNVRAHLWRFSLLAAAVCLAQPFRFLPMTSTSRTPGISLMTNCISGGRAPIFRLFSFQAKVSAKGLDSERTTDLLAASTLFTAPIQDKPECGNWNLCWRADQRIELQIASKGTLQFTFPQGVDVRTIYPILDQISERLVDSKGARVPWHVEDLWEMPSHRKIPIPYPVLLSQERIGHLPLTSGLDELEVLNRPASELVRACLGHEATEQDRRVALRNLVLQTCEIWGSEGAYAVRECIKFIVDHDASCSRRVPVEFYATPVDGNKRFGKLRTHVNFCCSSAQRFYARLSKLSPRVAEYLFLHGLWPNRELVKKMSSEILVWTMW